MSSQPDQELRRELYIALVSLQSEYLSSSNIVNRNSAEDRYLTKLMQLILAREEAAKQSTVIFYKSELKMWKQLAEAYVRHEELKPLEIVLCAGCGKKLMERNQLELQSPPDKGRQS